MANTIIGSSIVIDGEISGDEDLVIQGTVKGKITLKESLFVEGSGVVEADIDTQNVEIAGRVTGNIAASDKVELKTDCRVVGDIAYVTEPAAQSVHKVDLHTGEILATGDLGTAPNEIALVTTH